MRERERKGERDKELSGEVLYYDREGREVVIRYIRIVLVHDVLHDMVDGGDYDIEGGINRKGWGT